MSRPALAAGLLTQVQGQQQGIVIEHLLEMRHGPVGIDAVAMEAPAQLVEQPPAGHGIQGFVDDRQRRCRRLRQGEGAPIGGEKCQLRSLRELGGSAETAVARVMSARHRLGRRIEGGWGWPLGGPGGGGGPAQGIGQALRAGQHRFAAALPGLGDGRQHFAEAGHAVSGLRRKVGAAVEGQALRRQEDGHRPAAAPGHGLQGIHVQGIHVRALLPIHLDVDEMLVHQRRQPLVFEGFVGHHVAPMTGGVAYRQEDGPAGVARRGQRLRVPGLPMHGIVGMLPEVGRKGVAEAVHQTGSNGACRPGGQDGDAEER